MEKQWRLISFAASVTRDSTIREVAEFLNKHKLKPEEVKVVPNYVNHKDRDHADNKFGITILYYADKELGRT